MPEVSAVHIDRALTNIAVAYPTGSFIAPRLFADVPVAKQSDKYFIYDTSRRMNAEVDDRRAPGASARAVDYDLTTSTYSCEGHALKKVIPDEERENADAPLDPDMDATEFLTGSLMMNMEIDGKTQLDAALTSYASDPTNEWDDTTNGDPFADVELAIHSIEDNSGFTPNVMAMDSKVFRALRKHPDIIERVVYSGANDNPAQASMDAIAALFGFEEVIVGDANKNTAVQGQDASMSRVWGSDVYVAYRPTRPTLKVPALGYRMVWSPFAGAQGGWRVDRYRDADESARSDVILVEKYYDQKIVTAAAGYRLQNRLA